MQQTKYCPTLRMKSGVKANFLTTEVTHFECVFVNLFLI